jgi:hypothetical protein
VRKFPAERECRHVETALIHSDCSAVVLLKHQEMNLVQVEFVILPGLALNGPLFHSTLVDNDGWIFSHRDRPTAICSPTMNDQQNRLERDAL